MQAAQLAFRLGGGAWLIGYIQGEEIVLKALRANWIALKTFFNQSLPDAPLTKEQLIEVVNDVLPKK